MIRPAVKSYDWIVVGQKDAVVCNVLKDSEQIEIVYLDDKDKAINEDVRWNGSRWEFVNQSPCGGYADNNSRLSVFVGILRAGRRLS